MKKIEIIFAMNNPEINSLNDLKKLRTAPILNRTQEKKLLKELASYIDDVDWFTIGIMAPSQIKSILVLKEMEKFFSWPEMNLTSAPIKDEPVFLKANQKTGAINIRIEHGLGEGVLLGCQYDDEKVADTLGPLPLDIFKAKDI